MLIKIYLVKCPKGLSCPIMNNPDQYKTGEDKANKVQQFIQSRFVYALDSNLNKVFEWKENQLEVIENYWIDFEWQQVHPAICNISARIAVAYLRQMWVPAVVVTGDMRMSDTEYGWHAWIRYYDKSNWRWNNLDPTPTRHYWEVKYDYKDPKSQESYELYRKQQANSIEIGTLQDQKTWLNNETQGLLRIHEKIQNEKTICNNAQFLGYLLQGQLQDSFEGWQKQLQNIYDSLENKRDLQQITPFLETTIQKIYRIAQSPPASVKDNDVLYRIYFENHLAMLEELVSKFPDLDWSRLQKVIDKYKTKYVEQNYEELDHVLWILKDGKQLIVVQNKLFLRDKTKSFRMEKILDLSKYEEYSEFQVTPDGKYWSFKAKDQNGRWIVVKDGKETQTKYTSIKEYKLASNGDDYVVEEIKPNKDNYDGIKYNFYKNWKFLVSDTRGINLNSDKDSRNIIWIKQIWNKNNIFINWNILSDTNNTPIIFDEPKIEFFDNKPVLIDKKGVYYEWKQLMGSVLYRSHKKTPYGILIRDSLFGFENDKIYLLKPDGSIKQKCSGGDIDLHYTYLNDDGTKIAYTKKKTNWLKSFFIDETEIAKDFNPT